MGEGRVERRDSLSASSLDRSLEMERNVTREL